MAQPYAPLLQQMLLEFQNQRLDSAERLARSILRVNPKDLVALQVQGLCMAMQGRVSESVEPFTKAASLDAKNPEILANLGKSQHQSEYFLDASLTFEKLNRLIPNNPQILTDLGTAYARLRQYDKAAAAYDKAIRLDPNYFLVYSNQGNLLVDQGLVDEAIICFERALRLNPSYAEGWTNMGNAFFDLGYLDDACRAHDQALNCDPEYAQAWYNKANCLTELNQLESAFENYTKAYKLKPNLPFLVGQLINALTTNCDWPSAQVILPNALKMAGDGKPAVHPFIMLQTPANLALQKQAALTYVRERIPYINANRFEYSKKQKTGKIRLGYFSTDFKSHPVGILMENLIRHHDRSRFEVFGFFLNKRGGDEVENSLLAEFDKTVDLFGLNDVAAIKLILEQGLDVAIDLNGHTAGARTTLFANKVAPFQVSYLGYAGTSGSDFYDCLIADEIVIPEGDRIHYTEKIGNLPHSFFPVDTSITLDQLGPLPSRESQGLPEKVFVFCCFNNPYKITPQIFDVWMNLLKEAPNSVLWLSKTSEKAMRNLKSEATARGVAPGRIVFATRVPARKDHLSRLRLADLFLDTPNYNAHATAADALWAGVPVLTQIGETFAGRVAASQLTALGMDELITKTPEEYFAKALELANNAQALMYLRNKQEANRFTTPLFNTKQYVKDLESLYTDLIEKKS